MPKALSTKSHLPSEIREGREELSRLGAEEILDGVIVLYYESEGLRRDRALEIRKMHSTKHSDQFHFFEITNDGIVIQKIPEKRKRPKLPREAERPIEPAISLRALKRGITG